MTVQVNRTEAETALSHQFAELAPGLPGANGVPQLRQQAMRAFETVGLPHRRIEEWKYTDLRNGLKSAFAPAQCSSLKVDQELVAKAVGPALADMPAIRLVLVNGRFVARLLPEGADWPQGLEAEAFSGVVGTPGHAWIEACLARGVKDGEEADPVLSLNAAFASDGIVLLVGKGCHVDLPVHIISIIEADNPKAVAVRNLVKVDEGGAATVIEGHVTLGSASSQTTAVTQVAVGKGARLDHVKHMSGLEASTHIGRWDVRLAEKAVYRGFQLSAGVGLMRNESRLTFDGSDAALDLSGLMLGRNRDHMDTTLVVNHEHPGCESRELFKAVLDDRARAVFQGQVVVTPEAQKTDGKQMAQALMLSEDAEFDAKPELEIYADDVACGHGATSAEIDLEMLCYLRSRGIPETEARAMLIESFAGETFERLENEALREALRGMAL
ncbi:MAG: Fe-S cluster assembly protein SufD, partial [Hyphomicrobiaceae bacterium]